MFVSSRSMARWVFHWPHFARFIYVLRALCVHKKVFVYFVCIQFDCGGFSRCHDDWLKQKLKQNILPNENRAIVRFHNELEMRRLMWNCLNHSHSTEQKQLNSQNLSLDRHPVVINVSFSLRKYNVREPQYVFSVAKIITYRHTPTTFVYIIRIRNVPSQNI